MQRERRLYAWELRLRRVKGARVYAASGMCVKTKTKPSRVEMLKEMVRALGLNPEEILTEKALSLPHRTVITAGAKTSHDQDHVDTLLKALKQKLKQEITVETTDTALKTV